jgi:glycine/D-amino acid oxidase-like deaminating enzyme
MRTLKVDIVIVGAGIAGLWTANILHQRDLKVAICERGPVGGTQTMASQGLIHGGVKYALSGRANRAFEALSKMSPRWRDCLSGQGEIDLSEVNVPSKKFYLWSRAHLGSTLQAFLSSKVLRGRIEKMKPSDFPVPFEGQAGTLYRLDDYVIDVGTLVSQLKKPVSDCIFNTEIMPEHFILRNGRVCAVENEEISIESDHFVLAAGSGNGKLARAVGADIEMQRRPLKQVLVQPSTQELNPEPIFAHCITQMSTEPALTITTHAKHHYLGGTLASSGAGRRDEQQIAKAKRMLANTLPWIDWSERRFETLTIDRAEPAQPGRKRPDTAFVGRRGNVLVIWPTKLTLAPDLGDRVVHALQLT